MGEWHGLKGTLWICIILWGGIWHAGPAAGQDSISIDASDVCLTCLRMNLVASLGGELEGPDLLSGTVYVARSRSGRTYVSDHGTGAGEMFVYAADGQLEYTVARQGQGPGEFLYPLPIVPLSGGRWMVFDGRTGHMTMLDAEGGYVQDAAFPHVPRQVEVVGEQQLLVHGDLSGPDEIGFPFHIVDFAGNVARSFGPEARMVLPGGGAGRWVIEAMPGDRFLAARADRYSVEVWDLDMAEGPEAVFVPDAEWFRESVQETVSELPASVTSLHYADGLLWVLSLIPDPDWEPPEPGERLVQSAGLLDGKFDSVIEVFALSEARLVVRREFAEAYLGFLDDGTVYRLSEDPRGLPIWEIWGVRLVDAG